VTLTFWVLRKGPYEKSMWQIKVATALGTVALTGLVGAGVGVGYYVVNADKVHSPSKKSVV